MKNTIAIITLIFTLCNVKAQIIDIPDPNFKNALLNTDCVATFEPVYDLDHAYEGGWFRLHDADTNDDGEIDINEALSITYLDVSGNNISSLTGIEYFDNLIGLNCKNNIIETLNLNFNSNLGTLDCDNNLPLEALFFNNNNFPNISSYDPIEQWWPFYENHCEFLQENVVNNYSAQISISGCPNLRYVCAEPPKLGILKCVINSDNITFSTACSVNPNEEFFELTLESRIDLIDNDCINDLDTEPYAYLKYNITSNDGSQVLFSDNSGILNERLPIENYTITPIFNESPYYSVSPPSITINESNGNSSVHENFCITKTSEANDVSIIVFPTNHETGTSRGHPFKILFQNLGTTTTSGTINLRYNPSNDLSFNVAFPTPTTIDTENGLLSWHYEDLLPFEKRSIIVKLFTAAYPNYPIHNLQTEITSDIADINLDNNSFLLQYQNMRSNESAKVSCISGNFIDVENSQIGVESIGNYIYYNIITNTSAPAASEGSVDIRSFIDTDKLDINTLSLVSSSHDAKVRFFNANEVQFYLGSEVYMDNDPSTHITFKIRARDNLQVGDIIQNQSLVKIKEYSNQEYNLYLDIEIVEDSDGDGINGYEDIDPRNPFICQDSDNDGCDDCSQTGPDGSGGDPENDGEDTDGDGICNTGDNDDDNDGVNDDVDSDPTNPFVCKDADNDGCDDCSQTGSDSSGGDINNDGEDTDGDGICNTSDEDDDNDGVYDSVDDSPTNPYECYDLDNDGCDDCSQTGPDGSGGDINNDGEDIDGDGICDTTDLDNDNDGVNDDVDSDPTDPFVCKDADNDGCDDCSQTGPDSSGGDINNDGEDTDGDGICDTTDLDHDNDGVNDDVDNDPTDPFVCQDADNDGCDDCSQTGPDGSGGDVNNDGEDTNGDGICDITDTTNKNLVVYPNPANEVLHIESKGFIQRVTVSDSTGKVIYAIDLNGTMHKHTLSVSNWIQGLYFIEASTTHGKFLQKVVK